MSEDREKPLILLFEQKNAGYLSDYIKTLPAQLKRVPFRMALTNQANIPRSFADSPIFFLRAAVNILPQF